MPVTRAEAAICRAAVDTAVGGTGASVATTLLAAHECRRAGRSGASASNVSSHWIWGDQAFGVQSADLAHTGLGFLIHHASSHLWAAVHAAWNLRRPAPPARRLVRAFVVSAIAAWVDYRVVPARLTPGFEAHLGRAAIARIYVTFGFVLGIASAMRPPSDRDPDQRARPRGALRRKARVHPAMSSSARCEAR